jgi:hypothetical protein
VARRPRGPQRFRLTCRAPSSVYCVVLLCGSCEAEHLAKRTSWKNLKKRLPDQLPQRENPRRPPRK